MANLPTKIEGLSDEHRSGRPRTVTDNKVAEVVERTLTTMPKDATHWSVRSMAERTGVSHTTVHRIWSAFSLKPHRSETFKLSTDPLFVDKVQDIMGLYMAPPDRAVVLCGDENGGRAASRRGFRLRELGGSEEFQPPRLSDTLHFGTGKMAGQGQTGPAASAAGSGSRHRFGAEPKIKSVKNLEHRVQRRIAIARQRLVKTFP